MFNLFKKKQPQQPPTSIRDTLFGDMPFSDWPGGSAAAPDAEPWLSFVEARRQLGDGHQQVAKQALRRILGMPSLESRHYLQAWHFLRGLGEQPPASEAKRLYGVVVEVALENGLDIVAAYADGTARYFNYTGAAIIWERPDVSLDGTVNSLLDAGREVIERIGPWEEARPAAPPTGQVRINLLAPGGLYFGQGGFDVLASDPMGGPVIAAATRLMQELIAKTGRGS
jgi:hypothetical protein